MLSMNLIEEEAYAAGSGRCTCHCEQLDQDSAYTAPLVTNSENSSTHTQKYAFNVRVFRLWLLFIEFIIGSEPPCYPRF